LFCQLHRSHSSVFEHMFWADSKTPSASCCPVVHPYLLDVKKMQSFSPGASSNASIKAATSFDTRVIYRRKSSSPYLVSAAACGAPLHRDLFRAKHRSALQATADNHRHIWSCRAAFLFSENCVANYRDRNRGFGCGRASERWNTRLEMKFWLQWRIQGLEVGWAHAGSQRDGSPPVRSGGRAPVGSGVKPLEAWCTYTVCSW